tara:strand:+ start:1455 stop:2381 length:927 start_codon:yes stop_codon:yes gene_type:complete
MDLLRSRLLHITDFDELTELCCLDENITLSYEILQNINITTTPKNLLSSFVIHNCSLDIIGRDNIYENIDLIVAAKNIIYSENNDELAIHLDKYITIFNIWKTNDYNVIINTLCNEYFHTKISIINISSENIEKIKLIESYKNKIIEYAIKLMPDNPDEITPKIKTYYPITTTYDNLNTNYNKNFWLELSYNFDCNNFTNFIDTVGFLHDLYLLMRNDKKKEISQLFNINYFETILYENNYTNDDIINFANKSYDFIKSIHSLEHNILLENYRFEVNSNSRYLPDIIENIMDLTKKILNDIEKIDLNN